MEKIIINTKNQTIPTDFSWQMCMGSDHAYQLHRTDMCEQIKLAHDELGIKSLRFHGIFDDDMCTYQTLDIIAPLIKNGNQIKEVNFRQIGHIYDNLLSCGMRPFVELSFMPTPLASGKKTGLHYKNNITPPANYEEWAQYIKSFIMFLLKRYGEKEVEQWYFEVWNEPDLGIFFKGKKEDYFKLYEVTARAVKSVNPKLRVGGPSTSACKWIDEFILRCTSNQIPLDFVSTHHYPGDAFGNLITPGDYLRIFKTIKRNSKNRATLDSTMTEMFYKPKAAANVPKGALTKMDDELCIKTGKFPVIMTEWNSMAIFAVPVHDEKYAAAFIIKTVMDLKNSFEGYSFWCISDIYEESLQLNRPFFGGFGILTVDGIPKPNFYAFKILSKLFSDRLDIAFRTNNAIEYAAFTNGNQVQVLVYAQSNDPMENEKYEYEIELNDDYNHVEVEIIDDSHCNPKAAWKMLGEPSNLSKEQITRIIKEEGLSQEIIGLVTEVVSEGRAISKVKDSLRTNDVKLFTFYK